MIGLPIIWRLRALAFAALALAVFVAIECPPQLYFSQDFIWKPNLQILLNLVGAENSLAVYTK